MTNLPPTCQADAFFHCPSTAILQSLAASRFLRRHCCMRKYGEHNSFSSSDFTLSKVVELLTKSTPFLFRDTSTGTSYITE